MNPFKMDSGVRRAALAICVGLSSAIASPAIAIPHASFTASPNPASPGQSIFFDASGSSESDGTRALVAYGWVFGDGYTGAGAQVNHAFSLFGTYTVSLTVTNNSSPPQSDATTLVESVNQGNHAPVANAGGPYAIQLGNPISLNGAGSSDPDAAAGDNIVQYTWDLNGNGVFDDASGAVVALSGATSASFFPSLGPHTIRLSVVDTFGATATAATIVDVVPVPEPTTAVLSGIALVGIGAAYLRRRRRSAAA